MLDPALAEGLALLIKHEGFRGQPYQDTKGNWTVGYGRNLQANPFNQVEAGQWLEGEIIGLTIQFWQYPWFEKLNTVRRWVCLNMAYQLGFRGFGTFKKMIHHLGHGHDRVIWEDVASEMQDSKWAREFPERAKELAALMVRGTW